MVLTKNELEIMDVLWAAGKPLSRHDIIFYSPESKTWMDSSIHILINSMLKKGAIREAGFTKCGKTFGRVFTPAITVEEFYAGLLNLTKAQPEFRTLVAEIAKQYVMKKDDITDEIGIEER